MSHRPFHIVFPLFDGVTQLDFTAPHQVFSRVPDAHVVTASLGGRNIEANGLVFSGLADLATVDTCDMLCIPGGGGTNAAMLDKAFMREIRRLAGIATYQTSVCTGSFILAAAGLLRGKRATTHWTSYAFLKPFGVIVEESRVVRDGNIITGGGVTAGMDFALTVVAEIFGRDTAEAIQLRMEYAPEPPFSTGHPASAPAELTARVRDFLANEIAAREAAVQEALRGAT
jgi:transcriptional regulator GlxA family with amidase domain